MKDRLADLRYEILPGRTLKPAGVRQTYDRAFGYWRGFWEGVLSEVDPGSCLTADDFLRQDRVALLSCGDAVVGMHLLQIFDLDSDADRQHSFMRRYFDAYYFAALKDAGIRRVMSLEYLTVDPGWRGSVVGLSLAKVVIALSLRLVQELGVDAAVAAARRDVGVAKMAEEQGAKKFGDTVLVHGIPTDAIAFDLRDVKLPKDEPVRQLIEGLWARRQDFSQRSTLRAVA